MAQIGLIKERIRRDMAEKELFEMRMEEERRRQIELLKMPGRLDIIRESP